MIARSGSIDELITANAPVAIGVSGGKDSTAAAFAMMQYLDAARHKGERILIHSDLGEIEWEESLPQCERLAQRLSLELVVVRRKAGGLLPRWKTRWKNNVARFVELACVQLIMPWSAPGMRFCTSELKTDVITGDLVKRFPGRTIVSVAGIRRDESTERANAPVCKLQPKLTRVSTGTRGWDYHPILDWTLQDVYDLHRREGFPLHEAYTVYGASRVSCRYCFYSTFGDLVAAASHPRAGEVFREIVGMEAESTFSFKAAHWLADVAPHLLPASLAAAVAEAKQRAALREAAAAQVPRHLLYTKGWPTVMPTRQEAQLLASVRSDVADIVGLDIKYRDADGVLGRYEDLMREKAARTSRSRKRQAA